MGITRVAAEFLVQARLDGVDFGDSLTIGRQWLVLSPYELLRLLKSKDLLPPSTNSESFIKDIAQIPYYADPFFRTLGARKVEAMDISSFEGAQILHDLNLPIPSQLKERFDLVFDGGTLEHIFHFPNAIKNYMEMVKKGGRLMIFTVANNFTGHGFYQFSPELFYRIFTPANGFQIKRLWAVEDDIVWSRAFGFSYPVNIPGKKYAVSDPAAVHERVELVNSRQTALLIEAERVECKPIFSTPPLQSDYQKAWTDQKETTLAQIENRASSTLKRFVKGLPPEKLLHLQQKVAPRILRLLNPFLLHRWFAKETFSNRKAYQKIK